MTSRRASVVLPARGESEHLRAALASIGAGIADLEILIALGPGARPWAAGDPRVRFVVAEAPGPAPQRNAGIRAASSPFVAFLDDDDLWLPGHLERTVGILDADPSIALVAANARIFRDPRADGSSPIPDPESLPTFDASGSDRDVSFLEILRANPVLTPAAVARRATLLAAGSFEPSLAAMEDWDLWLRLALSGRVRRLAVPSVVVRKRPASASGDLAAMAACALAVLDRVESSAAGDPERARVLARRRAGLWHDLAYARLASGDSRGARAALREAIARDPARAKNYVYWLASIVRGLAPRG